MPEPRLENEITPVAPSQVAKEISERATPENTAAEIIVKATTAEQLAELVKRFGVNGVNHLAQLTGVAISAGVKEVTNRVPGLGSGVGQAVKNVVIDGVSDHLTEKPPVVASWTERVNKAADKLSTAVGTVLPGAELVGAAVKGGVAAVDTITKQATIVGEAITIVTASPELQAVKDRMNGMKDAASQVAANLFNRSK